MISMLTVVVIDQPGAPPVDLAKYRTADELLVVTARPEFYEGVRVATPLPNTPVGITALAASFLVTTQFMALAGDWEQDYIALFDSKPIIGTQRGEVSPQAAVLPTADVQAADRDAFLTPSSFRRFLRRSS